MRVYFDGILLFSVLVLWRALWVDQTPPVVAYRTALVYAVLWPIFVPLEILAACVRVYRRF